MISRCLLISALCSAGLVAASAAGTTVSKALQVEVSDAWSPSPPPGIKVSAGYFSIANHSAQTLTIVGVSSPQFAQIAMHQSREKDGVVSMAAVERVPVQARGSVHFSPGGLHLMMQADNTEQNRKPIAVWLHFEDGQSLSFPMKVAATAAKIPDVHSGHEHSAAHEMDHEH